jgi:hypothetical protein
MEAAVNATAGTEVATIPVNIIWVYVLVVAIIAFLPLLIDVIMTHKSQIKIRKSLLEKAATDQFKLNELKELIKATGKSPRGLTGLYRGTMAITVIVILGIALFHLLITRSVNDNQIIGNVLSMLGSLIAAIIGFYFGGRAVKEGGESANEKNGEQVKKG